MKRYNIAFIRERAESALISKAVPVQDAKVVVDSMLEADICGVNTHGIKMLMPYLNKIENQAFNVGGGIKPLKQSPSFTVIDASNAIGAVAASHAVDVCVERASEYGMHTAFVRHCNTFGPAFYYVEQMAKRGMIGFVCSNAPAAMPAFNGLEVMLGTNPMAFACPSRGEGNVVLDMATSIVAKSRFEMARIKGEKLQEGWALDSEGKPTTDPVEAIKGFVLPMAGFKGYGIAMAIDILSGFLSGASYLNKVNKFYSSNGAGMDVGQMFISINPAMVYEGDFLGDMDGYIQTLRNSRVVEGKTIAIPGDDRVARRKESLEKGIVLADDTVQKLENLFGEQLKEEGTV